MGVVVSSKRGSNKIGVNTIDLGAEAFLPPSPVAKSLSWNGMPFTKNVVNQGVYPLDPVLFWAQYYSWNKKDLGLTIKTILIA